MARLVGESGELRLYRGVHLWPRRAHFDPIAENCHLRFRELLLRRHLQVCVLVSNRLHQQRFLHITGNERRPVLAAFDHRVTRIEREPALVLASFRTVAAVAVLGEHGQHLVGKELGLLRSGFRILRERRNGNDAG